jgi:serine protease Do
MILLRNDRISNTRISDLIPTLIFRKVLNFIYAASLVTPGVVHIKTVKEGGSSRYQNPFEEFFNMPRRMPQQEASGSGVIISDDGYIVTNYHVVEGATEIEVTLDDNRKFDAKLIGEDPTTDLALLKIDENNLVFIKYGDSDNVQVGEWVLAVGNPLN